MIEEEMKMREEKTVREMGSNEQKRGWIWVFIQGVLSHYQKSGELASLRGPTPSINGYKGWASPHGPNPNMKGYKG